ncbi:MarR family transcriptional regulator [Leuconostocaceae bacterium ESL0958]|nr:MarR family transcriptional regulator [Leuconostocaceae bacterium ESL0958]
MLENTLQQYQLSHNQRFYRLYSSWARLVKQSLKSIELTHPQFLVLAAVAAISQQGTPVTQVKIADYNEMDVMTTSAIVTKLSRADLLDRFPGQVDSRSKVLALTNQGEVKLKQALVILQQIETDFWPDQQQALQLLLTDGTD